MVQSYSGLEEGGGKSRCSRGALFSCYTGKLRTLGIKQTSDSLKKTLHFQINLNPHGETDGKTRRTTTSQIQVPNTVEGFKLQNPLCYMLSVLH
ncbi:hypothetical protein AMELA_G00226730 [Ameiurus melas]|uniref:Uncharacterized protein n=1 Tax=Ameiurus melas TaxID=219545 RepID=A0A7J6A3T6_AMEME|nr:hypothetical protein AMELA_G00226730 [Ameiurus melas]